MTPHITLDPNGTGALYCQHCAELYPPSLPCTVERWIDQCRGFVLMHKHCPKPLEPSKQAELFDELAKREDPAVPWIPYDPPRMHFIGIDGNSDAPDPETDPPSRDLFGLGNGEAANGVGYYDRFAKMYPMAANVIELRALLQVVLTSEQFQTALSWTLPNPGTLVFDEAAHWARIEKAHRYSAERGLAGAIPGLTIPAAVAMPKALADVLGVKKTKRGARPLTNPRAKTRKSA